MTTNKIASMTPVGQQALSLDDFSALLYGKGKIPLDEAALEKVMTNFHFLTDFSADKLIYGINTGFGPMAQYKRSEEHTSELQSP